MWAMMEKLRMLFINKAQNQKGRRDAGRQAPRKTCRRNTKKALLGGLGNPQASALS
jgi:hypothetical protein